MGSVEKKIDPPVQGSKGEDPAGTSLAAKGFTSSDRQAALQSQAKPPGSSHESSTADSLRNFPGVKYGPLEKLSDEEKKLLTSPQAVDVYRGLENKFGIKEIDVRNFISILNNDALVKYLVSPGWSPGEILAGIRQGDSSPGCEASPKIRSTICHSAMVATLHTAGDLLSYVQGIPKARNLIRSNRRLDSSACTPQPQRISGQKSPDAIDQRR